ncbi:MAG: stage V sporulation protein AD [Peptococcaceae bacterium]|nr:stage V sporulation protein AD [Peptococcaceae bacterium]
MVKKIGKQTYKPNNPPVIISTAAVVGPFEGQGPLKEYFDHIYTDLNAGERTFEAAEREMLLNACFTCLNKAGKTPQDVDFFLAGDLLNQTITSSFSALELRIPYFGLYGACSTSAEGLALAAMLVDGGFASLALPGTSSHNASAERQYRYPTEYGFPRKPQVQWTVTGAGAALIAAEGEGPRITHMTIGKVKDLGIKDPLNLGAAMAPAAADTIVRHFADTGHGPEYYDLIVTGDLGKFGHQLTVKMAASNGGFDLSQNYRDCGLMIYDTETQDVHAGGSGCACSAVVTYGYLYKKLMDGTFKRILLVATGALHSPVSCYQGNSIPGIAHAVSIEMI